MVLDPANNLAETELTASVSDTATTLPVADASVFPDADSEGAFNVLVWDASANINASDAPDAEFVRVTATDTTADELTVQRGQEDTAASAKASGSTVTDTFSVKDRDDIDAGIAGKADDPHAHTGTDDGGAPLGRVPGQSEFETTLEDEGVSKVHNGVVYAGHPDFSTLQDAVDFAENNNHSAIKLNNDTTYPGDVTVAGNGTVLFSWAASKAFDTSIIDGDLTVTGDAAVIIGVEVTGNLDLNGRRGEVRRCTVGGDVTVNDGTSIYGWLLEHIYSSTINLDGGSAIVYASMDCDVTINSDGNVVVGNSATTVTDNGNGNEVGFNS